MWHWEIIGIAETNIMRYSDDNLKSNQNDVVYTRNSDLLHRQNFLESLREKIIIPKLNTRLKTRYKKNY